MNYDDFFRCAFDMESDKTFGPYRWQTLVAAEGLPPVLPVPTGLGKTEGVVLAWAWRRLIAKGDEPVHLVYCLPMRTLVRQTVDRLRGCFEKVQAKLDIAVNVYELMGGSIDEEWARWPDKPWALVGTQDQLLSRALNRGYAMNRFEWPVHFGLLNQDCLWIIDEVQLMGSGLWTTAQLDWMRQKRFRSLKPCRTTWMSATVGTAFLATTDRKRDGLDQVAPFDPKLDADSNPELQVRRNAKRPLDWFGSGTKSDQPIPRQIARVVKDKHRPGTLSLVVCNTVETARTIFQALDTNDKTLLTSRFRRLDREQHEKKLLEFEAKHRQHTGNPIPDDPGLICVSTQVVEAGLDISAHQLWSELAPWPSVIQRLGRLNRDGRDQDAHAWFWETPKDVRGKQERIGPYETDEIGRAKKLFDELIPLSKTERFSKALELLQQRHKVDVDAALQPKPAPMPRALDVHGLFSTERDVHGGFTDVSAFVRNTDPDSDLTVFWRDWSGKVPPRGDDLDGPELKLHEEGCAVPFVRLRDVLKSRKESGWLWNDEAGVWERLLCSAARAVGRSTSPHARLGVRTNRTG